jgi:hypothetical protein
MSSVFRYVFPLFLLILRRVFSDSVTRITLNDTATISRDLISALHLANFVKKRFKYLNEIPFRVERVSKQNQCALSCTMDTRCLSYNLGVVADTGGRFECQLLFTDMYKAGKILTDKLDYHHFTTYVSKKTCVNPCFRRQPNVVSCHVGLEGA